MGSALGPECCTHEDDDHGSITLDPVQATLHGVESDDIVAARDGVKPNLGDCILPLAAFLFWGSEKLLLQGNNGTSSHRVSP